MPFLMSFFCFTGTAIYWRLAHWAIRLEVLGRVYAMGNT